jgi:hypothetical protein
MAHYEDVQRQEKSIEKAPAPMTVDEISGIVSDTKKALATAGVDQLFLISEQGAPERVAATEKHNEIVQKMVDRLLAEKERFAHIFRTERGSIYFLLNSGESLRIRDNSDVSGTSIGSVFYQGDAGAKTIRRMVQRTFFVDAEESEKILFVTDDLKRPEKIIGHTIRLTDYREGAFPVEFDEINSDFETLLEEQGDTITVTGRQDPAITVNEYITQPEEIVDDRVGDMHLGNKITEVIK